MSSNTRSRNNRENAIKELVNELYEDGYGVYFPLYDINWVGLKNEEELINSMKRIILFNYVAITQNANRHTRKQNDLKIGQDLYLLEENDNLDYVYCDHYRVDVDGVKIKKVKLNSRKNLLKHGAGVMFRTEVLKKIGGYNETMRNCEDYDLLARFHLKRKKG